MVKLKGPGLATEASGTLADALTFAELRSRSYAKKHARPKNPKTPKQLGVRAMTGFLGAQWRILSPAEQASWQSKATAGRVYPYHAYIAANARRWQNFRTPSKADPAAEAHTLSDPPRLTLTPGTKMISVQLDHIGASSCWGYVLFRSLVTGFTPHPTNAVAAIPRTSGVFSEYYRDTPLEPGTYYYRVLGFRCDGVRGNHSPQKSATVT